MIESRANSEPVRQTEKLVPYDCVIVSVDGQSLVESVNGVEVANFLNVARQIDVLTRTGARPVLVTSGADLMGMHLTTDIGLAGASDLQRQGFAAIGQPEIMRLWNASFQSVVSGTDKPPLHLGQVLPTTHNYKPLTKHLLEQGHVPVICPDPNTDGDKTALEVANMMDADAFVMLTNSKGVIEETGGTVYRIEPDMINELEQSIPKIGEMKPKLTSAGSFASKPGNRAVIAPIFHPDAIISPLRTRHGPWTVIELRRNR